MPNQDFFESNFFQIAIFVLSSNCDQMDAAAGQTEAQIGLEYDIIRRQVRLNYYYK